MNKNLKSYHEEESIGRVYDHRLMRRLLRYLRPYWKSVTAGIILLLAASGTTLLGPHLIKVTVDKYVAVGDYRGLYIMVGIYFMVVLLGFFFRYFQTFIVYMTGQKAMYDMRKAIFSHFQRLSLNFYDKNPVGRLITRLTNDIDTLNELFTSGVVTVFGDIFMIVGIVGFLIYYNVKLALVTFSVLPILFFAAILFKTKTRKSFREIRLWLARINSFLQEHITGMKIDQIFNYEAQSFRKFDSLNRKHLDAFLKTIFYYSIFYPIVEVVGALAVSLIVWYGGIRVFEGELTDGEMIAYIMFVHRFYRPIQDLSEKYNILQSAMAASERVFKLLDTHQFITENPQPIRTSRLLGHIEFRNVWFAYTDEEYVLRDICFEVKPGESTALVGATGAGKTTISNLLMRFYEFQKGHILIDTIDIHNIPLSDLRRNMGLVLQDVFLFSDTIEENIRLWNSDIPLEKVRHAGVDVNADKFISRLTRDYRSEVKERGATFSAGQKQLLAFARALAYNPRILILDEATSNIDTETEIIIQNAVRKLMEGRTSLIIAHRLSTIQHVDKIIVLHKGRIREIGTHQELLANRGIYYKLYQLQYKDQEVQFTAV